MVVAGPEARPTLPIRKICSPSRASAFYAGGLAFRTARQALTAPMTLPASAPASAHRAVPVLAGARALALALALLTAAGLAWPQSAAKQAPPAPCSGPEFRQLDFWLGRWMVSWDPSPGLAAGTGTNTVTREYGGCVVQEAFVGGPATGGLVGHSVSSFHGPSQRWRQTWVDNQGGHFTLVGGWVDRSEDGPQGGRFVLVASRPGDGLPAQRMVFESITERSLTWRWQVTPDAGASWSDQWVIRYTRQAEPDPQPARAEAMVERLLSAVGGRAAWAALRNTVNDSQQHRADEPTDVRAVIAMDFLQPRWRIDTTAPGLQLTRVVDGARDWRRTRDGGVAPLSADTRQADLQWYAGHVYRTLARLARRDPTLQARLGVDGRLEVVEGARRIAWFRLTSAGQPYAFGGVDDGPGSICGPWAAADQGLFHPAWVASADGRWRSTLNRLQVNAPLADSLFEAPR